MEGVGKSNFFHSLCLPFYLRPEKKKWKGRGRLSLFLAGSLQAAVGELNYLRPRHIGRKKLCTLTRFFLLFCLGYKERQHFGTLLRTKLD